MGQRATAWGVGVKVIYDTNVLVSGGIFTGPEKHLLLGLAESGVEQYVSLGTVEELISVLRRKFREMAAEVFDSLFGLPIHIIDAAEYSDIEVAGLRDPRDAHVLQAALYAKVDMIVTGDADLLSAGTAVRCLRAPEALSMLRDL